MQRFFLLALLLAASTLAAQVRPVYSNDSMTLFPDRLVQGCHEVRITADGDIASSFEHRSWHPSKPLGQYPAFDCPLPVGNALHALAVEELDNLIEADTTWRTGKWWGGVWTRDVSYSSLLAAAYMDPEVTRVSLMRKVWHGRVLEDTGTGGSWPVSTDRVVWTLAAWQLYLVTGDEEWLRQSYAIVKNTLLQDEQTVFDTATGLLRGESTFLDWREETYPRWMQPADIAMSECLGTNAVYFRANQIASRMAQLCGDQSAAAHFAGQAERVRKGINQHLWIEEKGFYGQYLYGRTHLIVSPRSETLGEALCVIFGIADSLRAQRVVSSVALTPYGTPCICPQIPNIHPYHNNAVWPFVQSYWLWACAAAGNGPAAEHAMASLCRPALLYATWQENFVATDGSIATAMNSPNMLWSIAGALSMVHRQLMGINFEEEGLAFCPFVPEPWQGPLHLSRFPYRRALLDITVEGFGNAPKAVYLDGKPQRLPFVLRKGIKGAHRVRIVMNGTLDGPTAVSQQPVATSVETPAIYLDGTTRLAWRQVSDAAGYRILRNGREIAVVDEKVINGNRFDIPLPAVCDEYQVVALGRDGSEGFASEPLPCYDLRGEQHYAACDFAAAADMPECAGYVSRGAVELACGVNERLEFAIEVPAEGDYWLDFRYANGSDNLTDNNRSCNRTLRVDGNRCGLALFPQRCKGNWQEWGFSTGVRVHLGKGRHTVSLHLMPANENMSKEGINRAMLDYLRVRPL